MRLAVAGFGLESVTFLPETTSVDDFERTASRGDALIAGAAGTNSVVGGLVDTALAENVDLVGLVSVNAGAAASASEAAYAGYVEEIVSGLRALGDGIDGCLLHLHGALATPSIRRADLGVLRAIRGAMGEDFPLAVGMDLHGNLGAEVIGLADVITGYHFSPHTDMARTGERAAALLIRKLRGEIAPTMGFAKPGIMLPSIFTATSLEPLAALMRRARALEQSVPTVLDISVFCGFAYADVPDCGMSVVVLTDDDEQTAQECAKELADTAWEWREALFKRELVHDVEQGVTLAENLAAQTEKPICVLEHADRLNDSTYTLREVMRRGTPRVYAPFMFDPESAAQCVEARAGATIRLQLCGKSSPQAGGPLEVEARVLAAAPRAFPITGPLYTGVTIDVGNAALIEANGVLISLISVQWSAIDLDCFVQFDLDPADVDIVILRSKTHFRHVYEPLCEAIVIVDTPDWGPAHLDRLPYEYAPKSAFPLTP